MPFEKGNTFGGRRANAGRKPKSREEEVLSLLDDAWPLEKRRKAINVIACRAEAGDSRCFQLLLNYAYGTPASGDESKIQEALEAEFENLIKALKKGLSPEAWREVQEVLGLDEI